jgi:hypothetical protein
MLAAVRLVDGHNIETSHFPVHLAVNLLNATLLHDAGYLHKMIEDETTSFRHKMKRGNWVQTYLRAK